MKIKVVTKPNGKTYRYRKVRGKFVRLPDLPENHPEFLRAYIEAGDAVTTDGSLGALIGLFMASPDFKARKASTQAVWRRRLARIQKLYGQAPVDRMTTEHVQKALRKLTPGAARSERTIWRALFAYAKSEFWRTDNPATDAEIPSVTAVPHQTWSLSDIAAFRKKWKTGTAERQAFEVVYWTGARCVDAVHIGWQNVQDGVLEYVQVKTGGTAVAPITAPVAPFLEADRAMFLETAGSELLFVTTQTGKARSVKALSNLISRAARDAGLLKKTAHGLRRSRGVVLAEHGWTPHQIGAWLGHESLHEVTHYTRDANKRAMVVGNPVGNSGKLVPFEPYKKGLSE